MSTSSWLEGRRKNMREIWNKKDAIYNELIRQGKFKIIDMCLCSLNCKVLVNANYARIQSHQYSNLEFNFTSWDVNQRGIHNNCERNPSPRHNFSPQLFMRSALYQGGWRGFTFWRRERCWRNTSPAYKFSRDKFCSLERLHFMTKTEIMEESLTSLHIFKK